MDAWTYREGELWVEEVPLARLAEEFGTPLYVYSRGAMRHQYRALTQALHALQPRIHYAVKANSNLAVIQTFAREGAGADIVSAGEMERALRAGIPAGDIVFAGVGKTGQEIAAALDAGICFFTVESEPELQRIAEIARQKGVRGRIAMRVNPDVDPKTHRYTSTGKKESKFGVDLDRARAAYAQAASMDSLEIVGLHMHLGSPIAAVQPYADALAKVSGLCAELRATHPSFRYLDLGGGMGIPYRDEDPEFDLKTFAAAITPTVAASGLQLCLEPGRFLTGNAGVLLCRVQYVKDNAFKKFVIIDGAMNDLIRPALYSAFHGVRSIRDTAGTMMADLVGPVCESGDFMAEERLLPEVAAGDLLAVTSAGAYGFTMASNYNSRPRPAEIMVAGERVELVRPRETLEDLWRPERLPSW